jgi:organic hydroperoxide reductase OsmC/OhrA
MSEYEATIVWRRNSALFIDRKYSRGHTWQFDGGTTVRASASPHIVPPPYSVAEAVDPEEAFVASLSSCHMLWFLDEAVRAGYMVESYDDRARGTMAKNSDGKMVMTKVVLNPRVTFAGDKRPTSDEIRRLHHRAHDQCFIANSVKTEVEVQPA